MPPQNRRRRRKADPASHLSGRQLEEYLYRKKLETPLAEALPLRVVNVLETEGVFLVGELLARKREYLMTVRNFGEKTIKEVIAALKKMGVEPPADWLAAPPKPSPPGRGQAGRGVIDDSIF